MNRPSSVIAARSRRGHYCPRRSGVELPVILVEFLLSFAVSFLLLLDGFLLSLLRFSPFLVVRRRDAAAENCKGAVRISTAALDHEIAVRVANTPLVNRAVVATTSDLVHGSVCAAVYVSAIRREIG